MWEYLRKFESMSFEHANMTDDQLKEEVRKFVDERLEMFKAKPDGFSRFLGCIGYGMADEPYDEQLKSGFEHKKQQQKFEREVLAQIKKLEEKNS
jgi:hypothetical protein